MYKRYLAIPALFFGLTAGLAMATAPPELDHIKKSLRTKAIEAGVSSKIADDVLRSAQYLPKVSELSQKQPEVILTLGDYVERMLSEYRINTVSQKYKDNSDFLSTLESKYGVDRFTVAALWAMETNCGNYMGKHHVPSALLTLIYDDYRADYFSREFINTMKVIEQGHIPSKEYVGSWAGATGQVQFMPSSFLSYAVDKDMDGRKDLWGNEKDALASGMNYLKRHGWPENQPVIIPATGVELETDLKKPVSKEVLTKHLGPAYKNHELYFIAGGGDEPGYFVSGHGLIIKKWNRSPKFVVAVSLLAQKLRTNFSS